MHDRFLPSSRRLLPLVALLWGMPASAQVRFSVTITNHSTVNWDVGVLAVLPGAIQPNTLLDSGQAPLPGSDRYHTYAYTVTACDPNGDDDGNATLLIEMWSTLTEGGNAWTVGPLAPGAQATQAFTANPGDVMSFVAHVTAAGDDLVMMHVPGDTADQSIDLFDGSGHPLAVLSYDIGGYDAIDCANLCPPVLGCLCTYGNGTTGAGAGGSQAPGSGGCVAVDWYGDGDGDGYGDPDTMAHQCERPADYVADGTDCDDEDGTVNPGETEVPYDGEDDDCDPTTKDDDLDGDGLDHTVDCDDGNAAVGAARTWYGDGDGDGYGDPLVSATACAAPDGHVADATDCDDTDAGIHPNAPEVCDGEDQDCDGDDDDGVAVTGWEDQDGDGHGDPDLPGTGCVHVENDTDCDDTDPDINPGETEVPYDGEDDDCDPTTKDDDLDGDGLPLASDCDDGDDQVGAASAWHPDVDGDGWGDAFTTQAACEAPTGWIADASDCDDADFEVNPAATEVCNGIDDDCEGTTDEGAADPLTFHGDGDGDGYGDTVDKVYACAPPEGYVALGGDCDDEKPEINPDAVEWCDGIDNDCSGTADDDVVYADWYPDADGDGYGDQAATPVHACAPPAGAVEDDSDCDDASEAVHPGAEEICNGMDDDCDEAVDEDAGCDTGFPASSGRNWAGSADTGLDVAGSGCGCGGAPGHPGPLRLWMAVLPWIVAFGRPRAGSHRIADLCSLRLHRCIAPGPPNPRGGDSRIA